MPSCASENRRSIPACAGEPERGTPAGRAGRVYPRVCGGTQRSAPAPCSARGLSPACAGEPVRRPVRLRRPRVYPRVCGGTCDARKYPRRLWGLSPRVRGNLDFFRRLVGSGRSIPACAGEPSSPRHAPAPGRVYPRVCGGTLMLSCSTQSRRGLSPRVRGNPHPVGALVIPVGSIPACAGEPVAALLGGHRLQVYPRVCGGTQTPPAACADMGGLSPRVRGNRFMITISIPRIRSIPACAGEPGGRVVPCCPSGVYPRVCGGTAAEMTAKATTHGLSPRVRGNPRHRRAGVVPPGSIPACAGEPIRLLAYPANPAVYPRVCGGTAKGTAETAGTNGLSPRVRGNRRGRWRWRPPARSIPACAGEPGCR